MKIIIKLSLAILLLYISTQASAKTQNLIDIYRKEVFDIAVLRNQKPVIVFYSKSSCTLCTRLQTKLETFAKANNEKFYLARVDFDKLPALKEEFGITSTPTTRAFYKGKMVGEVKGPKWISMRELADNVLAL